MRWGVPAPIPRRAEHAERQPSPGWNSRLLVLVLLGGLWGSAVVGRLVYLTIVRHTAYRQMALRQQQRIIPLNPMRGTIYDRNGHELAVSLPVESCFAVPKQIKDPALVAKLLSRILGIPERDLQKRLNTDSTFTWVERRLPPETVARIEELKLKGIYFEKEMDRFYPDRDLASQVVGFVDIDGHGEAGVEYEFNKQISGKPGELYVLADGLNHYYQRSERPPVPGANIELTIDQNIQYIAEKQLAMEIRKTHAVAGSVLVMNPSNGAILAMANWPTFNPNLPGDGTPAARQNRAISDVYEPGSTFKTVTISAAIDSGAVTSNEIFNCQMGHIVLAGHVIHDWHPFGLLTVGQVLMNSSDVGAIKIALKEGDATFYRYMRAYGFGSKTGIQLPWESPGLLRPPSKWSGIAIGAMAMGQAVGVTTIQLIREISAIANGGMLYTPRIVREIEVNGKMVRPVLPPPRRVISATTAATMRHLMEGVVLKGTGKYAQLDGYTTAGKTGTSQKINPVTHRYSHRNYMSSFVGFAPVSNPAVVTLVVLDSPRGKTWYQSEGGWTAAPVFRQVMQQVLNYLGVPRDLPVQPMVEQSARLRSRRPSLSRRTAALEKASLHATQLAAAAASAKPRIVPRGMLVVPSLLGETERAAAARCLRLGLRPRLEGDGLAVLQRPAPGTVVSRGARVSLRFALRPALVQVKSGSGDAPGN